jgi:hypothetical protein
VPSHGTPPEWPWSVRDLLLDYISGYDCFDIGSQPILGRIGVLSIKATKSWIDVAIQGDVGT